LTTSTEQDTNLLRPARIIGIAVAVTTAVVATCAALVLATEIFLILFLAVLFGVFLNRCSAFVADKTSVGYGWCLGGVTLLLVTTIVGGTVLFGAQVDQQLSGASKRVDEARAKLQSVTEEYPTLRSVLTSTPILSDLVAQNSDTDSKEQSKSQSQESPSDDQQSAAVPTSRTC